MKRYDSYKDSGVKWLGEIPRHWTTPRISQIGRYINGYAFKPKDWSDSGKQIIRIQDLTGTNDNPNYFKGTLDSKYMVKRGDILVSWAATLDAYIWDKEEGWVNQHIFKAIPHNTIDKHFFLWLLKVAMENLNNDNKHGIMMQHLTAVVFNHFRIPLPPIDEQKIIANYLDAATSKIDEAIAQQQKMIDLLNERKQIIINNAVTKGLNSNAPMKDSGIDWIGQVPKHWRLNRLKTFLSIKDKRNYDAMATLLSVYTAIGVKPRAELEEKGNKASTVLNYKIVNKGDLIVNRLLAWMGAYGISNYDGVTSPDYDVYSFKEGYHKDLYEIMFRNTNFKSDCYKYGHGIMMMRWRTYPSEFLNILVPIPPYEEQKKIYDFLSPQIEKMNEGIEKCNNLISLLQERKQIIVNDVVTGKVKVV